MDEHGNPIPGPSKGFENEETMESSNNCDFAWLENEFDHGDDEGDVNILTNNNPLLNHSHNLKENEIESNPNTNIDEFFEEIKGIDFSQNVVQYNENDTAKELFERCNNFIDIIGRNIIQLEEMMQDIEQNIAISKRNATKAYNCIEFEKKSLSKTPIHDLKKKAYLANFFKIGLSNCPKNPHLAELYESGRLILSYNGRFILEECVERHLWNQVFKNKIEQVIHAEVLEKIKTPMLAQHSRLGLDRNIQNDPLIKNKIGLEMSDILKDIDKITKTPFKQLVFQFMGSDTEYDWLRIAKETDKLDLQCKRFWHLLLKPHVSRAKWTKDEDNKLIEIATKNGEKNWRQIAEELDTNRNELQCFVHYQKYKKMSYKKGKWSNEEDQKLVEIIKRNSIDSIINWQKVYFAMHDEGRSVDQIYNRWMFCLKPGIKKGFLNEREKLIISVAQQRQLPASVVSMNLTNRTAAQVRNAYRRNVEYGENIYRGGWTPEEDKMLLNAVNPLGPNEFTWVKVAEQVPGRNAEQCRHRFKLIEKKVQQNPKLFVENFPRIKRLYTIKKQNKFPDNIIFDENNLEESFKQNRQLLKEYQSPGVTDADRKLKNALLNNIYVTKHCRFASKCDLIKYVLDFLGADLVVPKEFVHKDDLIDEELMSTMTYLKEYSIETLKLEPNEIKQNTIDMKFKHEGVHDALRTSDIINSDLSEVEGLLDIRIRNSESPESISTNNQKSVFTKNKTHPLPLQSMGSIPPNYETFKMLNSYLDSLTTCLRTDNFMDLNLNYNWDNEESKKLHQRLVAILRWPALFSGLVSYNSPKINMIINTEQTLDSDNQSKNRVFHNKKRLPNFNLRDVL